MTRRIWLSLALVMVVASVHVAPAWAQGAPARAFRGLFGGNERRLDSKQTLDFTTEVEGGHDDNLLAAGQTQQQFDPRYQVGGDYGATNMALAYSTGTAGRVFTLTGRAAGDFRYSPAASQALLAPRYDAMLAAGLIKDVGMMTFTGRQSISYAPFRMFTAFPRFALDNGTPVAVERNFAITSTQIVGLNSEGRLGFRFGRRATFDVSYRRTTTDYAVYQGQLVDQNLGGAYSYRFTRYASLRFGYIYRLASYSGSPTDAPIKGQNIDAGLDYNRPLSLSRRTALTFNTGTASASDGRNMQYFATGGVGLTQDIGRSWNARMMVTRSLSYLDGIAAPFLTTGLTTEVGGYFGRRVDLTLTGSFADADSTLTAGRQRFTTYTGATRLRLALSRYGSVYAQYFYYQYKFRDIGAAIAGLPPSMERRGARVGVTWWVPLLR